MGLYNLNHGFLKWISDPTKGSRNTTEMNITQQKIIDSLTSIWKKQNPSFIPRPNHTCNCKVCDIENVIGWMYKDPNEGKIKVCYEKPTTKKRKKITNLYICKQTGQVHWCHSQCNGQRATSVDQGCVCTISGIRYESERADTWIPQYRITATAQEHRDPHAIRMSEGEYSAQSAASYRSQQHIGYANTTIKLLVFSKRRLYAEQRKYFEQRQAAEKLVSKYAKSCERQRQPVKFTNMVTLYINQIQRRRVFHGLLPKKNKLETIVKAYSQRVCIFWNIIIQKTPMGKSSSSLFSFKSFVAAALYIMKRGMYCSGLEIIPKDYYLESVLPEANTLDHYDVNKPTFTQAKNNIMRAIREAIETYRINPKTLLMPPFKSPFK